MEVLKTGYILDMFSRRFYGILIHRQSTFLLEKWCIRFLKGFIKLYFWPKKVYVQACPTPVIDILSLTESVWLTPIFFLCF